MADICSFYSKIGACRHGDKCSRRHIQPRRSDTLLIFNLYRHGKGNIADVQRRFDQFYKDVFVYVAQVGEIDAMVVCENDNDHLNGNVYVKFMNDRTAHAAMNALNEQWYDALPIHCELSPVESFQDANCRAYDAGTCTRGGHCNFMHIRRPSPEVKTELFRAQEKWRTEKELERVAPGDPVAVEIKRREKTRREKERAKTEASEKREENGKEERGLKKSGASEKNGGDAKKREPEVTAEIPPSKVDPQEYSSKDANVQNPTTADTQATAETAPAAMTTTSAVEMLFSRR